MSGVTTLTVTPSAAAAAYGRASGAGQGGTDATDFTGMLDRAIHGAIADGRNADAKAMHAIAGNGNITDVVTAVSQAQLALQTATAIRDRVVQAYQEIMRMPI